MEAVALTAGFVFEEVKRITMPGTWLVSLETKMVRYMSEVSPNRQDTAGTKAIHFNQRPAHT